MPRPLKVERNRMIIKLRDKDKMTFPAIAKALDMDKSWAVNIYYREKSRKHAK